MIADKVRILLDLIEKKISLEKKFNESAFEKKELLANKEKLEKKLDQDSQSIKNLKKDIASIELDINDLASKETVLKKRENLLIKSREVEALRRDISALQEKREVVEDELLDTIEIMQKKERDFKKFSQEANDQLTVLDEKLDEVVGVLSSLEEALAPIFHEIKVASAELPDSFKSQYQKTLSKVDRPIVSIDGSSCQGCYNLLTPRELVVLKKQQITECAHCHRIIYFAVPGIEKP